MVEEKELEEEKEVEEEKEEEEEEEDSADLGIGPSPTVENLGSRIILEPGEPGYDLDDDGLPGEPLPPLPQEVELYPSQELDPGYHAIQTEKVIIIRIIGIRTLILIIPLSRFTNTIKICKLITF